MTDAEILDWIDRTRGGVLAPARPLWPVTETTGGGLATLIPAGSSAGRNPALPAPVSADTFPTTWPNALWDTVSKRVLYRDTTPAEWLTLSNVHVPGYVDISSSTLPVTMTDCVVNLAFMSFNAVNQGVIDKSPIHLERCELMNAKGVGVVFRVGMVKDCYIHDNRNDAIGFAPGGAKRVIGTLCRRVGQGTGTHADIFQTALTVSDIITFSNTLYMPFTGSTYDEGTFGTTNVLNYTTDRGNLSDIMSVGDALIGGGYTVSLCPSPGWTMNGAAIIGSWFAKPLNAGGSFVQYGSFYPGAPSIGQTRNILIHNCRYLEDGSPVQRPPTGDANGLWDYDKATAPARFRQVCRMLGYTDWNDDPLVVVKTGFHTGTVV